MRRNQGNVCVNVTFDLWVEVLRFVCRQSKCNFFFQTGSVSKGKMEVSEQINCSVPAEKLTVEISHTERTTRWIWLFYRLIYALDFRETGQNLRNKLFFSVLTYLLCLFIHQKNVFFSCSRAGGHSFHCFYLSVHIQYRWCIHAQWVCCLVEMCPFKKRCIRCIYIWLYFPFCGKSRNNRTFCKCLWVKRVAAVTFL